MTPEESLPEERRKEIFAALVGIQDQGMPTRQSRVVIAERFAVSVSEIWQIEREGLDKDWPPL